MLQHGERGGLVFVRHDAAVFFLGADRVDALTRSADARLANLGPPLHAWFAGRRVPLRGVGVIGVIGQAELARDVRIVLVQVDHDRYELHVATIGDANGLLGVYTGADLLRGDLGAILLAGPVQRSTSTTTDPNPAIAGHVASSATAGEERPTPPPVAETPQPPPPPPSFTEEDHQRLDTCLTPRRREYIGAGATAMPHIYEGFRLIMEDVLKCLADALQQFGGPLRAKAIRAIMEEKRKAPIPGCPRTFTRGLVRVLAETGLGERVGRRFQLHLADWPRIIAMLRANYDTQGADYGRASPPAPSHRGLDRSHRAVEHAVLVAGKCVGIRPVNWLATAAHQHGRTPRPGRTPVGDLPQPRHDPGLVEPVVGGWRPTLRKDGRPTYYERLYDRTDGDSPSRFQGVNPNRRGSPDS
jgi:hypothetical protein